jgi:hypothetical protein
MGCAHVLRRRSVFHFRIRVPIDLASIGGGGRGDRRPRLLSLVLITTLVYGLCSLAFEWVFFIASFAIPFCHKGGREFCGRRGPES